MRREPPEGVKALLRKEVGFGCPVHGCRLPFLEFHHFDPPWKDRNHHEPDGMVALCVEHHKKADRGVFSKTQLRTFKAAPNSSESVRGKFIWAGPRQLVRLGGFYVNPFPGMLAMYPGLPQTTLDLDSGESGLLEMSFTLQTPKRRVLAVMERNTLLVRPYELNSLAINAGATKIKATMRGSTDVIQIESSRISLTMLDQLLDSDWKKYRQLVEKRAELNPEFRAFNYALDPTDPFRTRMINYGGNLLEAPGIPSAATAEAYRDRVVSGIRKLARSEYFDGDGVPLLNICKFRTWSSSGPISIDDTLVIGRNGHGFGCAFAGTGTDLIM